MADSQNQTEHCAICGEECSRHYFMCDEAQPLPGGKDPVACSDCFPDTPCGSGEHGEGCMTQVIA